MFSFGKLPIKYDAVDKEWSGWVLEKTISGRDVLIHPEKICRVSFQRCTLVHRPLYFCIRHRRVGKSLQFGSTDFVLSIARNMVRFRRETNPLNSDVNVMAKDGLSRGVSDVIYEFSTRDGATLDRHMDVDKVCNGCTKQVGTYGNEYVC
ncbi:hypothetical protein C5167_003036 [Papaver somniferum]|uniref:Uncharacterized protein n=1 Tax=Papaver somniferum TaxID=3469 RepID=A0A4Y7KZU1_PAPSO|nr:hypothetical protein C5167_003036 [Papaver somniferum]